MSESDDERPARITNMKCGPHGEEAPARDFLAIQSQTKLPLETSSEFKPDQPNSKETYMYLDDPLGLLR